MNQVPDDYPITGLCVVEDPNKCPPGYELILKSHDKRDDCDLWKDSFFKARITRYLCITRIFPLDGGRLNNVLEDIVINNERDPPPPGYSLIEKTIDSGDRATRKKQVCVKMTSRDSANSAINELIVLSRSKRPPPGYTLIGEINGLLLCFKIGAVPAESQNQTNAAPINNQDSAASFDAPPEPPPATHAPVNNRLSGLSRQDSQLLPDKPLAGVQFRLSSRFVDSDSLQDFTAPEINFRSLVDIENEYTYPFSLERHAVRAFGLRSEDS